MIVYRGGLQMFGVGQAELMIIAFVGILLFGNRLPKLMRDLGRGLTEFKRGLHEESGE